MHKIQFLLHRKHNPFNQSVLFTETNATCKDRSKHKNTLCGQMQILMLQEAVHNGLQRGIFIM